MTVWSLLPLGGLLLVFWWGLVVWGSGGLVGVALVWWGAWWVLGSCAVGGSGGGLVAFGAGWVAGFSHKVSCCFFSITNDLLISVLSIRSTVYCILFLLFSEGACDIKCFI